MGDLKWGLIRDSASTELAIAATQTITSDKSGMFVYNNSGAATMVNGTAYILGWAEMPVGTLDTGTIVKINIDPSKVYRIPITSGTYTTSLIGKCCDLAWTTSTNQGAAVGTSTYDNVVIVGGDNTLGYVDVIINVPNQQILTNGVV